MHLVMTEKLDQADGNRTATLQYQQLSPAAITVRPKPPQLQRAELGAAAQAMKVEISPSGG